MSGGINGIKTDPVYYTGIITTLNCPFLTGKDSEEKKCGCY